MGFININSKDFVNKALIIAGLLTILTGTLTYYTGEKQVRSDPASKFSSPMLALELSSTKNELLDVLGRSPTTEEIKNRKALNLQNFYDSFFLLTYPCFLALLFLFFFKANDDTPYREMLLGAGLSLCFIMLVSNIFENTQIYKLTTVFSLESIKKSTLVNLIISSRVKFAAIFISSMVIACSYVIYTQYNKNRIPKILLQLFSAFFMISGFTGFIFIVIKQANPFVENSMIYTATAWLLALVHISTLTLFGKKDI